MRANRSHRYPLRLALIGWGAISRRVASLLQDRVQIVAIGARREIAAAELPRSARLLTDPDGLGECDLDLVVEAAGRDAVAAWGPAALRNSPAFVVSSTSALTDEALLNQLLAVAESAGSQLIVPPGALAGVEALAAASILPLDEVVHRIVKPPEAWKGTEAERLVALSDLTAPALFFAGAARDAAARFPQNANVAVISALAGIGLDRTRVELVADPGAQRNRHELTARGDFGNLSVSIENRPLAANPKSSDMAALSLVRLIENRSRPLAR